MLNRSLTADGLKRLASFTLQRSGEDRIPQVAGSLTFTTVLSLVPLATVAFALFTAFPLFARFQNSLQTFLAQHLMPAQINVQIFHYLNQFAEKAKGLTTAGLIALVVISVMTLMTVESAFNVIWRVPKARPFTQRVLIYWAVITLGPILFGVSLSASSYVISHSMSTSLTRDMSPIVGWALTGAALPLTALAFTALYVYLPNCRVAWHDAVIGGIFAAVAFELAKRGFGFYIRRIPTYTAVYGAFAAVPIFLLWVYLSWFVTLYGAVLTATLPAIRIGQFHRPRFAGSDLLDALQLLAQLGEARDQGRSGLTPAELSRTARRDVETIGRLLAKLEAREWVTRLERSDDDERWILLANPQHLTVAALFELFVIERDEMAYQLSLGSSRIDGATLLAALDNERLGISLADLLAARRTTLALTRP